MEDWEVIKYTKKIQEHFKKKVCLCSSINDCQGNIVRSHTIQHKRSLEKIAHNNHVSGFIPNPNFPKSTEYFILKEEISINEASTFLGVCKKHDENLFHCIDDFDIIPSPEQILAITYRTSVRELYQKLASVNSDSAVDDFLSKFPDNSRKNAAKNIADEFQFGTIIGAKEISEICFKLSSSIQKQNYTNLDFFCIKLKTIPFVMCSGSCMPDCDYEGNIVNSFPLPPRWFALNIFSDSQNGIILLSWPKGNPIVSFLNSLFSQEDSLNKLIELAFSFIENTFFDLNWWNSLKTIKKVRIKKLLHNNTPNGGTGIRKNNLKYIDFQIIERQTSCNELQKYC